MRPRGLIGSASGRPRTRLGRTAAAALVLGLATGCTSSSAGGGHPTASSTSTGTTATSCGTTRSAANVPVDVDVAKGHVSCSTAMTIEQDYAKAIRAGQAPGNGGGGPIRINGWTCQGFATPIVLKTGNASKCVKDGDEILAVLPVPA